MMLEKIFSGKFKLMWIWTTASRSQYFHFLTHFGSRLTWSVWDHRIRKDISLLKIDALYFCIRIDFLKLFTLLRLKQTHLILKFQTPDFMSWQAGFNLTGSCSKEFISKMKFRCQLLLLICSTILSLVLLVLILQIAITEWILEAVAWFIFRFVVAFFFLWTHLNLLMLLVDFCPLWSDI